MRPTGGVGDNWMSVEELRAREGNTHEAKSDGQRRQGLDAPALNKARV